MRLFVSTGLDLPLLARFFPNSISSLVAEEAAKTFGITVVLRLNLTLLEFDLDDTEHN